MAASENGDDDDASFFHNSGLLHKSVYSSDEKKLGFVKKVLPDNIVIQSEFTWLSKYIVPKSAMVSITKKGIELKITAYEARYRYSYQKLKNTLCLQKLSRTSTKLLLLRVLPKRIFLEIYESIRYSSWQRNQLVAVVALVSGVIFLISGYKANVAFYYIIQKDILTNLPSNIWTLVITSTETLVIISLLGGITVLVGAGLFAANRVDRNWHRSGIVYHSFANYI